MTEKNQLSDVRRLCGQTRGPGFLLSREWDGASPHGTLWVKSLARPFTTFWEGHVAIR